MAVLTFTKIEENLIGDTGIVAAAQTSDLNSFLASTGGEKYILSSLNLVTDNPDQIREPITIKKDDPDGNSTSVVKVIQLDSYQRNLNINNYPLGDVQFDADTKFEYRILGNTQVKFTLNFNSKVRKLLSNAEELKEAIGFTDTIQMQVIRSMGLSELEEEQEKALIKGLRPMLFQEPEEKKQKKLSVREKIFGEPEEDKEGVDKPTVFQQKTKEKFPSEKKVVKKKKKIIKKGPIRQKEMAILPFDYKLLIALILFGSYMLSSIDFKNNNILKHLEKLKI